MMLSQTNLFLLFRLASTLVFTGYCAFYFQTNAQHSAEIKPNIIFILTDDQDSILGGLIPMLQTIKMIGKKGVTLGNYLVTTPLCCPSRSSILTGQYVHNHKVINNSVQGECSGPTWQQGPERRAFATHLKQAGYNTFFAGKYLNQYGRPKTGGVEHIPPGWDWWIGLVGNSHYYNYSLSVNGTKEKHANDPDKDYFTDVIKRRALQFLNERGPSTDPFFMMLSTPACHAPFTPSPKYSNNYSDYKAPRTKNFNIVSGKDKHWLLRQKPSPLPDEIIKKVDDVYRNRLRTLLSVDEMISDVIKVLKEKNLLEHTYIVFSSDNGYHLGQFALPVDKRQLYEFDIRVPMMITGPGIPENIVIPVTASNIDLAPTFLDLADIEIPEYMDGISLLPFLKNAEIEGKANCSERADKDSLLTEELMERKLLIEHSGESKLVMKNCPEKSHDNLSACNPDFACKCEDAKNNTYACIRYKNSSYNLTDHMFCSFEDEENFIEAYDLSNDPYQLTNLGLTMTNATKAALLETLNKMKHCRGRTCK